MVGIRFSKNRETILNALMNTKTHPDAEWVYEQVRKKLPKVGIATVYRNLRLLVENGEIMEIETKDGVVRYDVNTAPHAHFVCDGCGRITDLDLPFTEYGKVEDEGYLVKRGKIVLYGTCPACNKSLS